MSEPNSNSDNCERRFYGVILRVKNLNRVRPFYIHILGLGNPVVESNFWVEFEDPASRLIIALQQSGNAAKQSNGEADGNIAVCLYVDEDFAGFKKKLAGHGISNVRKIELASGRTGLSFSDPEGNRIVAVPAAG